MTHELKELSASVASWAAHESDIKRVWLFGSRVKGTETLESDLDVALDVHAPTLGNSMGVYICSKLDWVRALEQSTGLTIDLQLVREDDNIVRPAVEDHGLLIYEDDSL